MGKSKQGQRTKGNLQPSSSAKAAELLTSTQGNLLNNILIFNKLLQPQHDELEASAAPDDSDFSYVLKKLSKKDVNTKSKGLQEFGQLCTEKEFDIVVSIIPCWIHLYSKLSLDDDRRVRELCQECLGKLVARVRKQLAPHLKSFMGTWLMAQCDGHAPCAFLARKIFGEAFSESKQSEAVWFCKEEVLSYLKDILFKMTVASITESNVCDAEVIEERYTRLLTSALDAFSRFLQIIDDNLRPQLQDKLQEVLGNQKFWKFQKSESANVRRAFYDLMSVFCGKDMADVVSIHREQISRLVFLSVDDANPCVVPALWRAVSAVVCNVENCWSFTNMRKAFLPKLFSVLGKGGHGCAVTIYPVVVLVLNKLPQDTKMADGFCSTLLSKIRTGAEQKCVSTSLRECDAVVGLFVESCRYFLYGFIEKADVPNIQAASTIITDQVLVLLNFLIKNPKQTFGNSKSFRLVADLFWFVYKMSDESGDGGETAGRDKNRTSYALWRHLYKTCMDELGILLKDLLESAGDETLNRSIKFFQVFLSSHDGLGRFDLQKSSSERFKKRVSFEGFQGRSSNVEMEEVAGRSTERMKEIYRGSDVFRIFVRGLSSAVFSFVDRPSPRPCHVQLFRMLLEHFICEELIEMLQSVKRNDAKSMEGLDGSPARIFLKEVICSWMISLDVTLFPEVVAMAFVILSLETETERVGDFDFLLQELYNRTERPKIFKFFSILLSSSIWSDLWTRGTQCRNILMGCAAEFVEEFIVNSRADEQAWQMLCSALLGASDSSTKNQVLASLQGQLLTYIHQPYIDRTFDFVQLLFAHIFKSNSFVDISSFNSFDWFLRMLLFASLKALPGISPEVCLDSRKTLISAVETFLACNVKEGDSIEDFKYFHQIKTHLLRFVSNLVQDYNQLDDVVETAEPLLGLFYQHFSGFNIFSHFCSELSVLEVGCETSGVAAIPESEMISSIVEMCSIAESHPQLSIQPTSLESKTFLWAFCAKLLKSLVTPTTVDACTLSSAGETADGPDQDQEDEEDEQDFISLRQLDGLSRARDHESGKQQPFSNSIENFNSDLTGFAVNLVDWIARLTLQGHKFASLENVVSDFMSSLDSLVPHIRKREARDAIVDRIQSCLINDDVCDLDVGCYALFVLLMKISSVEHLWESLLSEEKTFYEMLLQQTTVNRNLLKVTTALLCFLPQKEISKFADHHLQLVSESAITVDKILDEYLLNSITIVLNATQSTEDIPAKTKVATVGDRVEVDSSSDRKVESESSAAEGRQTVTRRAPNALELLSEKIEIKTLSEDLFEGGLSDERVRRIDLVALNFNKVLVSKFHKFPGMAATHWDGVLCFVVSRLEALSSFCQRHDDVDSSGEIKQFAASVLSLVLELCKLLNSSEFSGASPQFEDEWTNVFQPSVFEHVVPIFVDVVRDGKLKSFESSGVLQVLCEVISYCPPTSLRHFLPMSSASSSDEGEAMCELLCPLLNSPRRCVQVTAHLLLQKVLKVKEVHLRDNLDRDSDEVASCSSQQEDETVAPPKRYFPNLMASFNSVAEKLEESMSTSKLFETVSIAPSNHSDLLSYMLNFDLIIEAYKLSPLTVRNSFSCWLTGHCISRHMLLLSSTASQTPSDLLQQSGHETVSLNVRSAEGETPLLHEEFFACIGLERQNEGASARTRKEEDLAEELRGCSFRIYARTVHAFPRIVRTWYSGLDQKSTSLVDKFTIKYVSPGYISRELNSIMQPSSAEQLGSNVQLKARPVSKELTASYLVDDVTIELVINFPDNSPLTRLKVNLDHNKITSVKHISSTWLLQFIKILNFKDGTLLEALTLLQKSLDRHFDGNSCMICFSLILSHGGAKVLPKLQCKTCKNKFHNVCLYTWFKSSNNANCPLCRQTF